VAKIREREIICMNERGGEGRKRDRVAKNERERERGERLSV
jgi:hypothetical protein